MFWLKYFFKNVALALRLIVRGDAKRVFRATYARIYRKLYDAIFSLKTRSRPPASDFGVIKVVTDFPVAYASPDHVAPLGTMYDNSSNGKFVLHMDDLVRAEADARTPAMMDLGCSGGQLVADFKRVGWISVGLEGSDYSLKHRRANWAYLANKNLFTCDITKPFNVMLENRDLRFNLITAWEVLEHIKTDDLDRLFQNIRKHLADGGYFIASTASGPSVVNGVELHQTQWKNHEWQRFIRDQYSDLTPATVGLKIHQFVRYDFGEPSFLVYRKTIGAPATGKPVAV
jgi:SAM-dependent methyltransferase